MDLVFVHFFVQTIVCDGKHAHFRVVRVEDINAALSPLRHEPVHLSVLVKSSLPRECEDTPFHSRFLLLDIWCSICRIPSI